MSEQRVYTIVSSLEIIVHKNPEKNTKIIVLFNILFKMVTLFSITIVVVTYVVLLLVTCCRLLRGP